MPWHEEAMGSHGAGMGHDGPRVLTHCHAGLGRSPAMAIVALVAAGSKHRPTQFRGREAKRATASMQAFVARHVASPARDDDAGEEGTDDGKALRNSRMCVSENAGISFS